MSRPASPLADRLRLAASIGLYTLTAYGLDGATGPGRQGKATRQENFHLLVHIVERQLAADHHIPPRKDK